VDCLASFWARGGALELRAHLLGADAVLWQAAKEKATFAARGRVLLTPRPPELCSVSLRQMREMYLAREDWFQALRQCRSTKEYGRPTMYDVREEIIEPLTRQSGLAFAELYPPQPAEVFAVHAWSQEFGDLLAALELHGRETCAGGDDWRERGCWVCAFAVSQHAVELGATLQRSAFYAAMSSSACTSAAVVIDGAHRFFSRSWCLLETACALKLGLTVDLCTSGGMLNRLSRSRLQKEREQVARLLLRADPQAASAAEEQDAAWIAAASEGAEVRRALRQLAGTAYGLGEVLAPLQDLVTRQPVSPLQSELLAPATVVGEFGGAGSSAELAGSAA
ncbi:unnamed protein product, partial [Prorocentrum cordatum]